MKSKLLKTKNAYVKGSLCLCHAESFFSVVMQESDRPIGRSKVVYHHIQRQIERRHRVHMQREAQTLK